MTDHIEPALTPEEWATALDEDTREGLAYEVCYLWGRERPHGAIAIANAALRHDDPRKIRRDQVAMLRRSAERTEDDGDRELWRELEALADALESYLPPE